MINPPNTNNSANYHASIDLYHTGSYNKMTANPKNHKKIVQMFVIYFTSKSTTNHQNI
jgi:hypothetical protein